jgi:Fe-S-cluster-containing hydrogenase component 2
MGAKSAREHPSERGAIAGLGQAPRRIVVRPDLCSGCRACEVACVAEHEGRFGTGAARIRVTKIEPLGVDHPHVCRLCLPAPCLKACPTGALSRCSFTTSILVDREDCIGCYACVGACPFGVVSQHPATGAVLICDLCGGDPACVRRCATGAIRYATLNEGSRQKRERLSLGITADQWDG